MWNKRLFFLMSFWVRAHIAENGVVIAPRHSKTDCANLLFSVSGWKRISRKMPPTTIALEWSSAETGVGPSIAEGSHGCRPNWADFPVAASARPIRGMLELFGFSIKICWKSQALRLMRNHAIARIKPMSPMRLYRIACRAAISASAHPYHHPISKNDINSHTFSSNKQLE